LEAEDVEALEQLCLRGAYLAAGLVAGVLPGAHRRDDEVVAPAHPVEPLDANPVTGEVAV